MAVMCVATLKCVRRYVYGNNATRLSDVRIRASRGMTMTIRSEKMNGGKECNLELLS